MCNWFSKDIKYSLYGTFSLYDLDKKLYARVYGSLASPNVPHPVWVLYNGFAASLNILK